MAFSEYSQKGKVGEQARQPYHTGPSAAIQVMGPEGLSMKSAPTGCNDEDGSWECSYHCAPVSCIV